MADEKKRLIRDRTAKRVTFKRQCLSQKKKLDDVWRRPRGLQSKLRKQIRAKGHLPGPGFGSPVAVRGLHPSGYEEVLVFAPADLEGLNPETHAIRVGGTVGNKKREVIQNKAHELGLKVINLKDASMQVAEAPETVEQDTEQDIDEEADADE
jgi:large subunit ribosomal protein L32e